MKMERLIGILTILLREKQVTAPELATYFEVSRRTINRDIETLGEAGIPIVTQPGNGGGIGIMEGYAIDKQVLSKEEVQILLTSLQGLESISAKPYGKTLMAKLIGSLEDIKEEKASQPTMQIDLASHYEASLKVKIALIKKGIEEKTHLSFHYYTQGKEETRRIEPYTLHFKWSSWYVVGYCLMREDFRVFKLNRMGEVESPGTHFEARPIPEEKKDLDTFFQPHYHFKGYFDARAKYRLIEEYGIESFSEQETGKVLFEGNFTNYQYLLSWALSFGSLVEVVEPKSLQEDILKEVKKITQFYTR